MCLDPRAFYHCIHPLPPGEPMEMTKDHIDKIPLTRKVIAQHLSITTATLICFPREVYAASVHTAPGTALLTGDCWLASP